MNELINEWVNGTRMNDCRLEVSNMHCEKTKIVNIFM